MKSPEFRIPEEVTREIVAVATRSIAPDEAIEETDDKPPVNLVSVSKSDWVTLMLAIPKSQRFEWCGETDGLVGKPLRLEVGNALIHVFPPQFYPPQSGD